MYQQDHYLYSVCKSDLFVKIIFEYNSGGKEPAMNNWQRIAIDIPNDKLILSDVITKLIPINQTTYEKLTLAWHPKKYILAVGGEDRKERNDKNDKNEGIIHLIYP